ncbi:unnamed protein product [Schistosoma mattheei]|uniref:Uncharacterized protein n=1 Tax=Schistosoma mattheei TaxID=31246 RepID=A0A183Q0J0_9TREM|nr:unnamed protein product [Schistosoma mattheei]
MLLHSDVGARDKIEGPALEALKEFLDMLYEILPASQEYKAHLSEISAWLNSKTSITGQEWVAYLEGIQVCSVSICLFPHYVLPPSLDTMP